MFRYKNALGQNTCEWSAIFSGHRTGDSKVMCYEQTKRYWSCTSHYNVTTHYNCYRHGQAVRYFLVIWPSRFYPYILRTTSYLSSDPGYLREPL